MGLIKLSIVLCLQVCSEYQSPVTLDAHDTRWYYESLCWSVTNYWNIGDNGKPFAFGGQADGDPTSTALCQGCITGPENEYDWVALPFPMLPLRKHGAKGVWGIKLPWYEDVLPVADTFGDEHYQAGPIYHNTYKQVVIPVDVFTPHPLHYLECGGELLFQEE